MLGREGNLLSSTQPALAFVVYVRVICLEQEQRQCRTARRACCIATGIGNTEMLKAFQTSQLHGMIGERLSAAISSHGYAGSWGPSPALRQVQRPSLSLLQASLAVHGCHLAARP